jgi:hypothetical protein
MAVLGQAVVAAIYGILLISAAQADMHSAAAITAAPAPGPALAVPTPAPAPKPLTLHEKVVAALRALGSYGAVSGLLDSLGENAVIKEGITFFAPDDSAFNGLNMNSSKLLMTTLAYHVSTSVYNYQQLSSLPLNRTIQTAAPNVVIFITSTGTDGLRLDDVSISDPDIYNDGQVAVHGISSVFNTAKYNKGVVPPAASPLAATPAQAPALITTPTTPTSTSPKTDSSDAVHVVASVARTVLLISSVSLVISLL